MAGSGPDAPRVASHHLLVSSSRTALVRYGFAILISVATMAATLAITPSGAFTTFFLFPVAIAAASLFGGFGPGLTALLLSAGELAWFIVVPYHMKVPLTGGVLVRYAAFGATIIIVWLLAASIHKSRQELQRMNLRFGGVVQISEDAIISVDEEQRITLFNPGAEKIFGYAPDEILGKPLGTLIPERLRSRHNQEVKDFIGAEDVLRPMSERRPIYGLRKDVSEFPAEASISKFSISGETVLTVRLRDISERQMAERGLHELAAIVEFSEDAIVGENLDGFITSWNKGAEKMYGYTAPEAIGQHANLLVPADRAGEVDSNVARAYHGEGFRLETARRRKDGKEISVGLSVSPIRDKQGQVVGVSTIARDISERKRLEEQLRQSQKMEAVGRLAGGIAHDFNNLLSIIVGYTYVLQSSLPDDDGLRNSAQQVMQAAEKASSLTRQLLAFSRRQVLQPEVIDLNMVLDGMEKMLPRLIGEDIDLRIVRGDDVKRVKADPSQIEQVLMNLVVNSRDAMPNGGKLTIETAQVYFDRQEALHHGVRSGEYVLLAVSDTGVGMDAKTRAHIFEPFFTTKEAGRGTGLGLATVYGIVTQSNGYIWVYSEPGRGTTFKIYFPATASDPSPSRISQKPHMALAGTETILLVEDEPTLRELMQQVLSKQGYKVYAAQTGAEGVKVAKQIEGPIHLLVTDVVMPRMGGQQLADLLRAEYPEMLIVFMSGYTDNALVHSESMIPGTSFLQKPFTPDVLLRKVREVLDGATTQPGKRQIM